MTSASNDMFNDIYLWDVIGITKCCNWIRIKIIYLIAVVIFDIQLKCDHKNVFNHILYRQQTFTYDAEYWNDTVAYNESAGTSLNEDETKLSSFWSTPFTRLCLGMKRPANGVTNWIALNYPASSLRDVIGDGTFRPTNLSVTEWKKLLNNSGIQVKSLYVEFPLLSQ